MSYRVCRFCRQSEPPLPGEEKRKYKLIKYAARHYAHPDCALRKIGAAFFDRLTAWQLGNFPALAANECGLLHELTSRIGKSEGSRS